MSAELVRELVRGGWLTLAFMMLLSRALFQIAGPERMRGFLDGWEGGAVRRGWGATCLGYAAVILAGLATGAGDDLSAGDLLLLAALVAVLVLDGLVNALPAGFGAFKQRMQAAWVARTRGTGREGDRHLFGAVNALLALGAAAAAAVVVAYRPIDASLVALALGVAAALTAVLVGGSVVLARRRH